jgi:hypothetical protein
MQDPFWTGHEAPGYEVGAFHQLHCLVTCPWFLTLYTWPLKYLSQL